MKADKRKIKSFWEDFKKHVLQAFATLIAGFIIGALFGGARVIEAQNKLQENQESQAKQLQEVQISLDSLALKDYYSEAINGKVDSIYSAVKEQGDDIEEINKTVDRIFQILR